MQHKMQLDFITRIEKVPSKKKGPLLSFCLDKKEFSINKSQPIEERIISVIAGALIVDKVCRKEDDAVSAANHLFKKLDYPSFLKLCQLVKLFGD